MKSGKNISLKEALLKAQHICAEQEKCEYDIRKKLYDWKLPVKEHDSVINSLLKDKFIDEKRYAHFYVKDKFHFNKWGKIKIEYTLKQKNISSDFIKSALNEIPDMDYEDLLKNELIKKLKSLKQEDEYTVKSKLMQFAISRGFENGKVFDMVSKIIEKYYK